MSCSECMCKAAVILIALLAACGADESSSGRFRFVFWRKEGRGFEAIRDRATLESGDVVGMALERDGSCHVYLVYRDAAGKAFVLTPGAGRGAGDSGTERVFEAPLDDTAGLEVFHLIASVDPLSGLESAIAEFRAGRDDGTALMAEVQRLRTEHEDTTVAAARPVPIGGRLRGEEPEDMALEYDVSGIVCHTFTIDHK